MDARVEKRGKKWAVVADNKELYIGKTRVSCFKYAHQNGLVITAYTHVDRKER